jgi:ATPase subunit of ABC transporter with duplicated ATPase domains
VSVSTLEFRDVTFLFDGASEPLIGDLSVRFGRGWTGIIGPNGAGKTTLLRLACDLIEPTSGSIGPRSARTAAVYCPQRTDDPPARFDQFMESSDAGACSLRGRLAIEADWKQRWPMLSHGERKRAQIATALWQQPQVLAIDEPTNHIDREARSLLEKALHMFGGIGLLVSHDRELLDALCTATLFMQPPTAIIRPGGYSKAMELAESEQAAAWRARENAKRDLARIQRAANERAREASMADRKRSKRDLAPGDSDGRGRINLAIVSGKDGQAGRQLRQLQGRLRQVQERVDATFAPKASRIGMELLGDPSSRNILARLEPGELRLGESRALRFPDLFIRPQDRIAIVGPNGAGKSTLIRHLIAQLDLPPDKLIYMPQEIDAARSRQVLDRLRRLDHAALGLVMSAISSLGSHPQRLLETDEPSPGEMRKILLAEGMSRRPNVIIMDEPTNHLDLPSIECLERALEPLTCALLLVSHDMPFLHRLARTKWEIVSGELFIGPIT